MTKSLYSQYFSICPLPSTSLSILSFHLFLMRSSFSLASSLLSTVRNDTTKLEILAHYLGPIFSLTFSILLDAKFCN